MGKKHTKTHPPAYTHAPTHTYTQSHTLKCAISLFFWPKHYGRTDSGTDGWRDGFTDRGMNKRIDGRTDQ